MHNFLHETHSIFLFNHGKFVIVLLIKMKDKRRIFWINTFSESLDLGDGYFSLYFRSIDIVIVQICNQKLSLLIKPKLALFIDNTWKQNLFILFSIKLLHNTWGTCTFSIVFKCFSRDGFVWHILFFIVLIKNII